MKKNESNRYKFIIKSYLCGSDYKFKNGGHNMNYLMLFGNLGTPEIIIIALIVLLLFGGRKIPELMKGLGKGVKNFKEGVKGIEDEVKVDDAASK
jgi:sec-independent protein translocase protein TatA